ncbi:MAG: DUF1015 domain-containing protein [Lachnospiraceae bacterium]|nr:DUF1015 domain-containing protein [Lachnospiraceae bacterium]
MADFRPFKSIRPREDLASRIAALPYDVFSSEEARAEVEKEPLSFLRIDRPETNFEEGFDLYSDQAYDKAAEIFESMIRDGQFIQDDEECFYLYSLTMSGRTQTGIVGVSAVDDLEKGIIKRHENTREDKEKDRIRHIDRLNAQTGPIFLAFRSGADNGVIKEIALGSKSPIYDFTNEDGVRHRVFKIGDKSAIARIQGAFDGISDIYICDGHHRCASARRVAQLRREADSGASDALAGRREYDYFLSVVFPSDELCIYDYNRLVKDLNSLSEDRFLDRLRKKFIIESKGDEAYRPEAKGNFGMYLSGCWYRLILKENPLIDDPVFGLDVSILQNELFSPILNIEDPKRDPRISFVGGVRGLKELENRVDSREYAAAFSLYPTSIDELFKVSDAGLLMPPKSTWFEPKLRSGLFIHKLG